VTRKRKTSNKRLRIRNRKIFNEAYPKDGSAGPPRVVLANRYNLSVSAIDRALASAADELRRKNERMYLAQTQQIELVEPEQEVTSEGLVKMLNDLLTNK